jgi:hypothetical protein
MTIGPWSEDAQHGGPPAALLAGAIERASSDVEMMVARITVELLRPVPVQPLRLNIEIVRPGRKVQLVAATLAHNDTEVARALALRIRMADLDLPFSRPEESLPRPEDGSLANFFDSPGAFATEAMEIRMIDGDFNEVGPGRAWLRLKVPVVEGEETTAVERVAAASDFGNGVSNLAGNARNWVFINPDLEIRMYRPPEGEWVYLDSETRISPNGTGMATSKVGDLRGWLGVAAQSLFVGPVG